MAGKKGKSGRPPKPQVLRLADGTHRSDRHGDGDGVLTGKPPVRPEFTNPWAAELWDVNIAPLIALGVIEATDTAIAKTTCDMYGLYCAVLSVAEDDPTDKDTRIALATYWSKFEQGASRLGLTPSDRSRLKITASKPSAIEGRKRG